MSHQSISARERDNPGEIRRVTGHMTHCEICWKMYRRMCVDFRVPSVCGCCTVPAIAAKPDSVYTDGS